MALIKTTSELVARDDYFDNLQSKNLINNIPAKDIFYSTYDAVTKMGIVSKMQTCFKIKLGQCHVNTMVMS